MTTSTPSTLPIARSPPTTSAAARFSLHARRPNHEVGVRVPAPEDLDDVAQRRAVEGRDDSDLARQGGQRPFAGLLEQALRVELLLQLLERELQCAKAVRLDVLALELIFALRLIDAKPPPCDDVEPVLERELEVANRRTEHHATNLRCFILQREVGVARVPDLAVGDLTLDPDVAKSGFEHPADFTRQLADGVHAALGPCRRRASIRVVFLEWLREEVGHSLRDVRSPPAIRRAPRRRPRTGSGARSLSPCQCADPQ